MKRIFAIILAFSALTVTHAQTPRDSVIRPFDRPLMLSFSYGRSFNTSGNDNEYWFGRQPGNRGVLDIRLTYMFVSHWGVYGDISFSSGGTWTPPIDLEWEDEVYCGINWSGGIGIGLMYRYEYKRWQFFARSGIGACTIDNATGLTHFIDDSDDQPENLYHDVICADRYTNPSYVNFGITGGYRLTHVSSLIFDINYRYPYTSSKVEIKHKVIPACDSTPQVVDIRTYHSRSWGNNLTFSIGIQLQCELNRKKTQKTIDNN